MVEGLRFCAEMLAAVGADDYELLGYFQPPGMASRPERGQTGRESLGSAPAACARVLPDGV